MTGAGSGGGCLAALGKPVTTIKYGRQTGNDPLHLQDLPSGLVLFHPLDERVGKHQLYDVLAVDLVTADPSDILPVCLVFHSLGQEVEVECVRHFYARKEDSMDGRGLGGAVGEGAIHIEHGDGLLHAPLQGG